MYRRGDEQMRKQKSESTDQIYFVFSRSERVPFSVKTSESFLAIN